MTLDEEQLRRMHGKLDRRGSTSVLLALEIAEMQVSSTCP